MVQSEARGEAAEESMRGIFPRIPETATQDAAGKGRFGVVQNLGSGMVRHLICGVEVGGLHLSKSSLFRSGLEDEGLVYRPIAALSADPPLDRCYPRMVGSQVRCHRGTGRCD